MRERRQCGLAWALRPMRGVALLALTAMGISVSVTIHAVQAAAPTASTTRVAGGSVTKVHATDTPGQTIIGNLTETNAGADGFITVFPCAEGLPTPLTSNINFSAGINVANTVTVKSDAGGNICFTPNVATDLVWDQVAETAAVSAHNAARKLDTRTPSAGSTRSAAGTVTKIHATDIPGQTIIGNLTETNAVADGFVTVYPCDSGLPAPLTSNLNFTAGVNVANGVTVAADDHGDICATPNVASDLVWDQVAETSAITAHNAKRLLDTRTTPPPPSGDHFAFNYYDSSYLPHQRTYTVNFVDPLSCTQSYIGGFTVLNPSIIVDLTPNLDAPDGSGVQILLSMSNFMIGSEFHPEESYLNYGYYDPDATGKRVFNPTVNKATPSTVASITIHVQIKRSFGTSPILSDQRLTYNLNCA